MLLAYPASHACALLDDAGRHELTLGELSQVALASGASLWIAPLASPGAYAALQDVVARLRVPDGCPWDRELTWVKMRAWCWRKHTSCSMRWMPTIPAR